MDRRAYLTALGATAAALSGCSEENRTGTTATPTERASATPERSDPSPRMTDVGLMMGRGEYTTLGDIRSVGQGGSLVIGTEYDLPASEGSASGLVETRVFDSEGTRLDTNTTEVTVVADGDSVSRQAWFAFGTADWTPGDYTAEVLVNSHPYGTTVSETVAFEIVEPLGAGEVEMYIDEFPDDAVASEEFDWTLGFRNVSDRDSSVVTDTVLLDPARGDSVLLDVPYRENVPAGGETTVPREDIKITRGGTYTYRIEELDAEVGFTLGRAEE